MAGKSSADLLTYARFILASGAALSFYGSPNAVAVPLILTAGVFLTDYFDGIAARMHSSETLQGALLDILADFYYILLMHALIAAQGLIPGWYLAVIVWKFAEFVITSYILSRRQGKMGIVHDPTGKLLALWFYGTPAWIIIVQHWRAPMLDVLVPGVMVAATVWAATSSVMRILSVLKAGS